MIQTLCVVTFILVAGLFILVRVLEASSVFFPSHVMENNPGHMRLAYEDVFFLTADKVKLNGWLVKNSKARATVLFAHGNAGNMSDRMMKVKFFHDLGLNVFIFDYRGFGRSQGHPSERGIYQDAQAAFDYLKVREDLPSSILGYGASLGGVVIIDLATHRPLNAVVLDSTITSAKDMAARQYPFLPYWMMSIQFNSIDKIKNITVPKLIIHSPDDHIVPFEMGLRLFKQAPQPKEFLKIHGGHNDAGIITDHEALNQFVEFLKKEQFI